MASVFSKPKAPDTSAQEARLAKQEEEIKAQEMSQKRTEAATLAARQRRRGSSLLTGPETGVLRETLG